MGKKRRTKKYLALLIASSMVFSTGMVALAEDDSSINIQTDQVQDAESDPQAELVQEETTQPTEQLSETQMLRTGIQPKFRLLQKNGQHRRKSWAMFRVRF